MSTRHQIILNLIVALSAWAQKFEEDVDVLKTHKTQILGLLESLQEMNESMNRLRQLLLQLLHNNNNNNDESNNNQTNTTTTTTNNDDDHHHLQKFMIDEAVDGGEEHESRIYEFIENCCGEMMAWNLADPTEEPIDPDDIDEDDELYVGILEYPTELKELILGINNGNQERKEIIDRFS